MKTTPNQRKKPGPPRTTGPGEQVVVRLHHPLLGAIDAWRAEQTSRPAPTRAEALRRLAAFALEIQAGGEKKGRKPKPKPATAAKAAPPKKARPAGP